MCRVRGLQCDERLLAGLKNRSGRREVLRMEASAKGVHASHTREASCMQNAWRAQPQDRGRHHPIAIGYQASSPTVSRCRTSTIQSMETSPLTCLTASVHVGSRIQKRLNSCEGILTPRMSSIARRHLRHRAVPQPQELVREQLHRLRINSSWRITSLVHSNTVVVSLGLS